ncbi:hypothetical protein QUB68_18335 [Microcoleus sp. A006_D1]|uniref:hypothetical protein n=1 Tax=Microcoleus sp. A006_D1 TaxID=3055267 RepID=UPI002FD50169
MKTTMTEVNLPFYELFSQLLRAEFHLGICDYTLLMEALDTDVYSLEPESVKQLLKTLWVKSRSQKIQFDAIFDRALSRYTQKVDADDDDSKTKSDTANLVTESPRDTPEKDIIIEKSKGKSFFFPATSQSPVNTSVPENREVVKAIKTYQQDLRSFKPTVKPNDYLPVTEPQMVQGWYNLKRSIRMGTRLELDVDATIEQTKRQGKLVLPVMSPRRLKYNSLLLLIDQRGSMQPFHVLSRQLVATAQQTGCLTSESCYYFHNYPHDELYCDSQFNTEIPLEQVIAGLSSQHTVVLIFSDAGAARRDYTPRRIRETQSFLERLKREVKTIVWLNPIPTKSAWEDTTAGEIAKSKIMQMFPADSKGFQRAIEVLQ